MICRLCIVQTILMSESLLLLDLIYALIRNLIIVGLKIHKLSGIQINCLNRFRYLFRTHCVYDLSFHSPFVSEEATLPGCICFSLWKTGAFLFTKRNASLLKFHFIAFPKRTTFWWTAIFLNEPFFQLLSFIFLCYIFLSLAQTLDYR